MTWSPSAPRAAQDHGLHRSRRLWLVGHRLGLTVLLLPSLLLIGLFTYYPAVKALIGGFYSWDGFNPPVYAGTCQFSRYIHSSTFFPELRNLAVLFIGSIMITCVVQFTAARSHHPSPTQAGLDRQYALVLPIVMPPIVLISIWAYLYAPTAGLINEILHSLGLGQPNWLADPHLALISILFIGFPWISNLRLFIFLGGLQNLPTEILEASLIDGVGRFRRFSRWTCRCFAPIPYCFVISRIRAVQNLYVSFCSPEEMRTLGPWSPDSTCTSRPLYRIFTDMGSQSRRCCSSACSSSPRLQSGF